MKFKGFALRLIYKVSPATEQIIYDSRKSGTLGYDFTAVEGRHLSGGRYVGERASGELRFLNGMIDILRTNDHGKYEVMLKQYSYGRIGGKEVLPQNSAISGKRRLRVSCEVKILESPHTLRFLFKSEPGGVCIASHERVVDSKAWTPINQFFEIDPAKDCYLRIDDYGPGSIPSSVQIRNIVVAERTASNEMPQV